MCGPNLLLLRSRNLGGSFSIINFCARGEIYDESMSQPFLPVFFMGIFLVTQCVGVN